MKDPHYQPPFTWIFIGAKGSFTPLHCDVWMTDAWMAQFEGRKVFRFRARSTLPRCELPF